MQSRLKVGASALALALAPTTLALPWTLGLGGCAPRLAARSSSQAVEARRAGEATTVSSNVLRSDYAGSAACAPCHGDIVASWRRSPMHRMTRLPDGSDGSDDSEVRAPFDGHVFAFRGDTATLETEKGTGTRFMRLRSGEAPGTGAPTERLYRVTKLIGGRYREDFAGVEVASTAPGAPVLGDPRAELILPVSYVFQTASFRLKGYSVLVGERPRLRAGGVWNQTCIFCHNTVPYFDDLWGALHGAGAPGYQGEVVDRLLPPGRRARYAVTSETGVMQALDAELSVLGARPRAPGAEADDASDSTGAGGGDGDGGETLRASYRRAIRAAKARFTPANFIEVGVGCEACHGGSREHVDDPGRHPSFEPVAPFLSVTTKGSDGAGRGGGPRGDGGASPTTSAEWQNRACARCHQVLFSRYPRTWEGGLRREPATAGGSSITSGEGRDFLLGGCARAMACTTCHDPHGEDARARLARLATPAGNGVCTTCHGALSSPAALATHAHHDPAGAGGACVACHMPRKNMGLGYALTRYHRIGSPTDPDRVERDRPLECALCHADKTVGTVLDDIARLWGKRYDADAIVRLYGSRDANVLTATIARGDPHEQAAAIGSAGEQRFRPARGQIERAQVSHAFPLVRYFAAAALAALDGAPLSVDAVDASLSAAPARASPPHEGNDDDQD